VQFRGEGGRGVSSARITPPLGLRWKIKLQDTKEKISFLNPPVIMDNTIYFGSGDGNFYALDVESGYMRWVFKSGAPINSIPYADKDKVYFGSEDGRVYALSRETGEEIWRFQTWSQINSQVQRYGNYIIFVGDSDAMFFISPDDGKEIFRVNNPGWRHYTFCISDGIFYLGTGPVSSLIGPFDIEKREFLWWMPYEEMDAWWYSPSAVKGDLMFIGTAICYSGTRLGFHAFNRHTGKIAWSKYYDGIMNFGRPRNFFYEEGSWGEGFMEEYEFFERNTDVLDFMAPTVWKNTVIFTGGDSAARGFDTRTGLLLWERVFNNLTCSAPTTASGRVYFGLLGDDRNPPQLVCLAASDGNLLWQMDLEGSILSAPVIAGNKIVFGTDENVFYVLEEVF
jgi:outer membrane protein assembly factor BamB